MLVGTGMAFNALFINFLPACLSGSGLVTDAMVSGSWVILIAWLCSTC